jgi:HEAT repeat protein
LGRLLRQGMPASRESALNALADMATAPAIRTIANVLDTADADFHAKALGMLSSTPNPLVTETCARALSNRSPEVRMAALLALGKLAEKSALPQVKKLADKGSLWGGNVDERIAAIKTMCRIGGPFALECLESISSHRRLISGRHYGAIRAAAAQAVLKIHEKQGTPDTKAA